MLDEIAKALGRDGRFAAWQVTEVHGRSHQRYAVFGDVETRREVERRSATVRVLVDHGGALMGESSFTLATGEALKQELDLAHERASLVQNPAWSLPGEDESPSVVVETCDPRVIEAPRDALEEIGHAIAKAARAHRGVDLASSEVFCDYERVRLVNSLGLERDREETSLYTEYVLLARGQGDDEVEVYRAPTSRRLAELDLEREIALDVEATFAGLKAKLPDTGLVDVVIGGTGVEELFDAFLAHASGPAAFERWTRLRLNEPVLKDVAGERLTLWADATVPGGRGTHAFDSVGLPGGRHTLVEDGSFVRRQNDRRHACWLSEPATGDMGNLVVASGEKTEAELLTQNGRPLLWLQRFSQLSPHPHSGGFSGEIRHGFRIETDGSLVPVKGGSVSGNVFDAFQRAWFSQERATHGRTHCPRAVRLDRVQVTGA
jgi:predicted Zn-dependent protease